MTNEGGKYIEVEAGVKLFVQDVGSGDPIVFIPGWTFTTEVFSEQIAYFSKTRRVIVIDPRSHGRSTMTQHGNDYVTHGADLAKVLETLELEDVTLVGWSFGCLTIWEYIRQHGVANIKSSVFVDLSPKPLSTNAAQDWVEGSLDDIAAAYTTYLQNSDGQRTFIEGYAKNVMVQRELEEEELNWIVDQSLNTPFYIAANLFSAGMFSDYRTEAKLASESVPTLTIVAEHWAEIATAFTHKVSPQSKVEVLGGHLMFWEHNEKFNKLIEQFEM
ncbi:alpha/beta fold hydrolase [Sporosarcina sp. G11-34]|uniref:alpha/beta fold hydrolase n=1 Tax=Sporosarcina sp. G11-34 TaxID=2849605 RepID=UPI0022A938FB|nr:alpha/beta hydrolase [Sporosarcina sp. G11-34]MCZ2259956.1 alpha/beta hydrolase [Sporosarcina sp. G11-34]